MTTNALLGLIALLLALTNYQIWKGINKIWIRFLVLTGEVKKKHGKL